MPTLGEAWNLEVRGIIERRKHRRTGSPDTAIFRSPSVAPGGNNGFMVELWIPPGGKHDDRDGQLRANRHGSDSERRRALRIDGERRRVRVQLQPGSLDPASDASASGERITGNRHRPPRSRREERGGMIAREGCRTFHPPALISLKETIARPYWNITRIDPPLASMA